jgi:hypothetical protein
VRLLYEGREWVLARSSLYAASATHSGEMQGEGEASRPLRDLIRPDGGMGGASAPTHVRTSPAPTRADIPSPILAWIPACLLLLLYWGGQTFKRPGDISMYDWKQWTRCKSHCFCNFRPNSGTRRRNRGSRSHGWRSGYDSTTIGATPWLALWLAYGCVRC